MYLEPILNYFILLFTAEKTHFPADLLVESLVGYYKYKRIKNIFYCLSLLPQKPTWSIYVMISALLFFRVVSPQTDHTFSFCRLLDNLNVTASQDRSFFHRISCPFLTALKAFVPPCIGAGWLSHPLPAQSCMATGGGGCSG